jgi:hypothetical protein
MASDLVGFWWDVLPRGYRWVRGSLKVRPNVWQPGWMLVEDSEPDEPPRLYDPFTPDEPPRLYDPFTTDPGLFRNFAEVSSDRDSILAFANQYGMLGIGTWLGRFTPEKRTAGTRGETPQDWGEAIAAMRRAVELWRMVENRDVDRLSTLIRPSKTAWVYTGAGSVARMEPVIDLPQADDVVAPARFFVARWINDRLQGSAMPQLRYEPETGKWVIQLIPGNLLSAMWLQFAQSIARNKRYRTCKGCSRWFEISTDETGFRINREFCSDACKSRDYRKRKDQARRLKAEGKTIVSIARELGTDVETIKKWTSKREV